MDSYLRLGTGGGYISYLELWIGITTEIIRVAREARRAQRVQRERDVRLKRTLERRPKSLNPPPDGATVSAQWHRAHQSLLEVLRFGSLLLDLEPTVDNSLVMRPNRAGTREVIVARNPGLKGWLHRHCRAVRYQTAMRYKALAQRARRACGLPGDVPIEWAFPDQVGRDKERSAKTPANLAMARAELAKLLASNNSATQLLARLDERLAITHRRLPTARGKLSPLARRRRDERSVEAMLATVRTRLHDSARPLGAEARELLRRGLRTMGEELRAPSSPAAAPAPAAAHR